MSQYGLVGKASLDWGKPSVGRIVHYTSYGTPGGEFPSVCRAAIIAEVCEEAADVEAGLLGLAVFNPQGLYFNRVPYSAEPKGGTWHWPEFI